MALDFLAGCLGGCAGVLVGHPFDTAKVHIQTQNSKRPIYKGTFHCLRTLVAKDSVRGLYRGMSSPIAGVAFVNAIVFGVYGNVQRCSDDPSSLKTHIVAGATAGLVQSVICSPMELAKTRLQLQSNNVGSSQACYKGPLQCLSHIRKTEGFRGIFRGLGITAARDVPGFASYFVSYELMTSHTSTPSALLTLTAGGFAGAFSWLITFPIDVIKSRLQADGLTGTRQYNGAIDCLQKGYQSEGAGFLMRGLSSALVRAFPMNAACFFVVSQTMRFFDKYNNVSLNISQPEPLTVIASISQQPSKTKLYNQLSYHRKPEQHKSNTIRSLVFLGAFSEAVCSSEILELANDLYDDTYSLYDFNTHTYQRLDTNNNDSEIMLILGN